MLQNNHEIVFIYDVTNANPNGDPNNENEPRMDQELDINEVTDVRIKRTIRDYLYTHGHDGTGGKDIFCRQTPSTSTAGALADAKMRASMFKSNKDEILSNCIDIRIFGGMIPIGNKKNKDEESGSLQITGPIQFSTGRSLNKVISETVKGTGAFSSTGKEMQQTFRTDKYVKYSLLMIYGRAMTSLAKHSNMTDEDYNEVKNALWVGHNDLTSRTKIGHVSRLLIDIKYKPESNFIIAEPHKYIKMNTDLDEFNIRDIGEVVLDLTGLYSKLEKHIDCIESVEIKVNDRVRCLLGKDLDIIKVTN